MKIKYNLCFENYAKNADNKNKQMKISFHNFYIIINIIYELLNLTG